jgi:hypothetical protein
VPDRARWFAAVAALAIALTACAQRADGGPPISVALGERGVELPAGGVAAIAVTVERSVDGPLSLTFDPLASSASIRGTLRPAPGGGAVLTVTTSRGLAPGVYDALVVARGGNHRAVAPLQFHVVAPRTPLQSERRHPRVGDLGYDAVARSQLR